MVKKVQDQRRAEKKETSTNSLSLNLGEKVRGREWGRERERKVKEEE